MRLERFVGLAVRRKQQVDQQIIGNANILGSSVLLANHSG